jgi:hypothetical protein
MSALSQPAAWLAAASFEQWRSAQRSKRPQRKDDKWFHDRTPSGLTRALQRRSPAVVSRSGRDFGQTANRGLVAPALLQMLARPAFLSPHPRLEAVAASDDKRS